MQIDFQLDEEYAKKLEYIQERTEIDLLQHIKTFIDLRYRQLQPPVGDPLAKLKNSPLIGSFKGPPDLAENSKAFLHATMGGRAEVITLKPGKSLVVITESPEVDLNEFENKDEVKN
jgi:hypothetical protein